LVLFAASATGTATIGRRFGQNLYKEFTVRFSKTAVVVISVCVLSSFAFAQAPEAAPAAAAPAATSQPTSKPALRAPVLMATVGDKKIMSDKIDMILASAPADMDPARLDIIRQRLLGQLILQEVIHAYMAKEKIECTDTELKTQKEEIAKIAAAMQTTPEALMASKGVTEDMLRDEVRFKKLMDAVTAQEKVDAFVKAHPDYFNGTSVTASHILVQVEPTASTEDQKAALKKINDIAKEIQDGKISFEDAAKKYSDCPSKEKGGDLGSFTFDKMVPPFAEVAFATPVGKTSDVLRSSFGYHIVKVTKREDGKGPVNEKAQDIAKGALLSDLQIKIVDMTLADCPIVIVKAGK
jgi:parvulin-like peptidyl-prolyl isomerase